MEQVKVYMQLRTMIIAIRLFNHQELKMIIVLVTVEDNEEMKRKYEGR